jgi:hypothetical protein
VFFVTVTIENYKRFSNTCLGRERNSISAIATVGYFVPYGSFRGGDDRRGVGSMRSY